MKFWNNRGFSLVSVMVAAGLLGGLSLALMQVMKNIRDGQSRANSAADEAEMMVSVRMVLDNPNYCKMSLAGEDPVGSPVTFKKKDIDFAGAEINAGSAFTETSEGLDVDLWYSNVAGDSRTFKKFNGADNPGSNDKSKFGKLNITSMKLIMNNGLGGCSGNYCEGTASDTGQLVIIYEKKISSSEVRKMKKFFNVNVGMSTDSSGNTTILSCTRERDNNTCTDLGGEWDSSRSRCIWAGSREGFCTEPSGQNWGAGSGVPCDDIPGYTKKRLRGIATGVSDQFQCCYVPDQVSAQAWCSDPLEAWNGAYSGCSGTHPLYHITQVRGVWSGHSDLRICCFLPKDSSRTNPVCTKKTNSNSSFSGCASLSGYNSFQVHALRADVTRNQACCWFPN